VEIPVVIEPVAGHGYRAVSAGPPGLSAEAPSRDEALAKLRQLSDDRVRSGTQFVTMTVPDAGNPWVEFAGMFKDDPYFDEVIEIMKENRRKMDADPDVP